MMMLMMMVIVGAPPIRHASVPCCWAIRPPLKFKVSLASSSVNLTKWKTCVKGLDLLSVTRATAKEISVGDDKQQEVNIAVDASESTGGASSKDEDWEKALRLQESSALENVKVEGCNSGGLIVRFGSIAGFLPFSQLGSNRSPEDGKTIADVGKSLIGQTLLVKVLEASKGEKRLVVSEKKAMWLQSVKQLKNGDIFEGKVNYVTDFGAFVDLRFPDGSYSVTGLVHVSELSWDRIYDPRDVVQEGQTVRVKVTSVDLDRMRLALSIKQLQTDPLLETLDTLMQQEDPIDSAVVGEDDDNNLNESLPGLDEICQELLLEDGINEVVPGRMVIEKRVVSQDLELWLSSAPVEFGSFTLLARAGRQVQEVQVKTTLDKEGLKAAVQRVTGRVP